METFEWIIGLLIGASVLSIIAHQIKLPYPALLAVGGAALALLPHSPNWVLDPSLALTLFLAPVLLDAAYDSSLRDLKRHWLPVGALAIVAVIITTAAVAVVIRWLVPDMPWAIAIALGALVAPPDAAAATAVMRRLPIPHNIRTILEGESLVNDASALLLFRFALSAAAAENVSPLQLVPAALISIVGSVVVGVALAWVYTRLLRFATDAPTSIILQFGGTFGVWILAESFGLSGILTIVAFAITGARSSSRLSVPAERRVPINAVWESVVFALNALAFVLIGMQLRPIIERIGTGEVGGALGIAVAVLITAIAARFGWVMVYSLFFSTIVRSGTALGVDKATRATSLKGGMIISWAGMRGIVTLAGAFSLPEHLPYRDLVLLCAFTVVLGTLVIQGLSLRWVITVLKLDPVNPIADEVRQARAESMRAALAVLEGDTSIEAKLLRREFEATIETSNNTDKGALLSELPGNDIRRSALAEARKKANELWQNGTIGDAAYRSLESEFDWGELSAGAGYDTYENVGQATDKEKSE